HFELFDPSVYAANPLQKSLGDLMINSIIFCWLTLFTWSRIKNIHQDLEVHFFKKNKYLWAGLVLFLIMAITFIVAKTIRSLAADSNISFDVINFFSLTLFSVLGFAVLSVISIGYYYFIKIMLVPLSEFFKTNFYQVYFIIAFSGLTFLTLIIDNPILSFFVFVLIWLLLYISLQRLRPFSKINSRLSVASTLFWIFLFSVSITMVIIDANREKEWELRKRMAMKIDLQSDPYNERQLSISFTYIDDDFLQENFKRFENPEAAQILRDSIFREGGYLSRYDSRLYVFNHEGKALYKDDAESLNTLNTIVSVQSKPTTTADLYYYETAFDKFTFIFRKEARDEKGSLSGTLFIVSYPGQYGNDALYPELFRQANQHLPEESPVYSYAIYKKGILLTGPSNSYSFSTSIMPVEIPLSRYEKRINNNYDELWYKASNDKIVVIAKKKDSVIEAITLFSYVFCAFLFLVALFKLLVIILQVGGDFYEIKKWLQWNIRTQIHGTIIFISILSFIIIGIATISFFIQRYEQNNSEKLSSTMQIMVNEMEKKLAVQKVFDDQLAIYDSASNQDVQKLVNEVSEIHNVDVNVYDTSGNLQVTSQPLIYREGILSRKIHPHAFYHLHRLRQVKYIQEEKLASLNYLSIYAPIRDNEGQAYAFLNIPYFLSQRELKQEISYFLVTIINLNAFIFLIAGVVALFITNRVTRSFSLISDKMKEVNLGRTNEEIIWGRDDEIG
ncbi:MAG TPA: Yip1 family protein, partial [Chitinophagaceae bacterium]|nr:Yip1 family protein [Chitinophagaceae bacterium]